MYVTNIIVQTHGKVIIGMDLWAVNIDVKKRRHQVLHANNYTGQINTET